MKIINRKKIYSAVLSVFALAFFSSCEIGLGPSVDLQAPEVEITSHKDNDSVGPLFVVKGTASDNEAVTSIQIDFNDADMHYMVDPVQGQWKKKINTNPNWQIVTGDSNYYCNVTGGKIEWSIGVDSTEKIASKTDNSFTFEIVVTDKMGNSGRKSKALCTLTVDTNSPVVSIYKPELFTGSYTSVESLTNSYSLKDGNVLSRLMNGSIVLTGRQDQALSFKALRIELDNGKQSSGISKVTSGNAIESMTELLNLDEANLGDSPVPSVYYSKDITGNDLREWSLTIKPEDWVTPELSTGKHIIRVVSTSLSTSNAWERKILGYFVWYPEADNPWIVAPTGYEVESLTPVECYPGSDISGSAQDDDGIKSIVSTIYKKDDSGEWEKYTYPDSSIKNPINHALLQSGTKYSAWSIKVPSGNGKYKYVTTIEDIKGNKSSIERYFKTSDVSAPKIEIISPSDNSSAIVNSTGDITFNVKVTDDGEIKKFAMVWLNPALRSDPSNKIKYLTGTDSNWNNASVDGWEDSSGNIIYKLGGDESKNSYEITKKFNFFSDFKIGQTVDGKERFLCAQDFIFLVSDGNSNTVKSITLSGDNISPEVLEFTDITIDQTKKTFTGDLPTFPSKAKGMNATITGKWKDMLTSSIENKTRLYPLEIKWGDKTVTAVLKENGTWNAEIIAPEGGGTITATLKDFGGNIKIVQEAASIETAESGLSRIDCISDDGSYNAGKTIKLTLEFTKNTTVNTTGGTPYLTLSNGGTASYISGSGETSHVYSYTVTSSSNDDNALYVKAINANGAKWIESSTGLDITNIVKIPENNESLKQNIKATRKIKVDNTKPKVKSVSLLSSTGYYKEGGTILFMVEFSEDVEISGVENLHMNFKHTNSGVNVKTSSSSTAGSKYVLLTYNVASGDNASPVKFDSFSGTGVAVIDNGGNELDSWAYTPTSADFTGVIIDTSAPSAPVFKIPSSTYDWNPAGIITSESGTSFCIQGETNATIEYSLDNGDNWLPYGNTVANANPTISLTNNGTYKVVARQTDIAGNISSVTDAKDFVINKGELLKKITATTTSGTYTDNKTGVAANDVYINGKIEFRTAITVSKNAYITLNVKDSNGLFITVPLEECKTTDKTASTFTFKYKVSYGDIISDNKKLDVTGWSLGTTKLGSEIVNIDFPSYGSSKTFAENREIYLLTGNLHETEDISFIGEGKDAVLKIKFNRAISKVSGDIIFRYYDTIEESDITEATISDVDVNDFHIPVVLSSEDYSELAGASSEIKNAYIAGMNGATKNGSYLENDTSTKYILDYSKDDTESTLVDEFKSLKKNIVSIPVISDSVSIESNNTLKIALGETYMLPVKGAKYKITIPAGAVADEVQNVNSILSFTKTAEGVESPQIRIKKGEYTITGTKGNTKSANAKMADAQKAYMKISCRTPGAFIKYNKNEQESSAVNVNRSPQHYDTKTGNVVVNTPNTNYTGEVTLGNNSSVSTYSESKGLKIAISANATKGSTTSSTSYEYANRTVLKFVISGKYDSGEGSSENETAIIEGGTKLKFKDLRVWVIGGDSPSGTNSLDPFPLSWGDNTNFKLMQQENINKTYSGGNLYNNWWWVTWDLSAPAYHGFVLGDVPTNAETDGPTIWYAGECAWTATKSDYILYPGETLVMAIEDAGTYHNNYLFRLKNKGVR